MGLTKQLAGYRKLGQIKPHAPSFVELQQHLEKARRLLDDARRKDNSLEGRFENGNSAGHSLLMVALKMQGYRPTGEKGHRALLYQILDDLLPAAAGAKGTLARVHNLRNRSEYDGDDIDITQGLVEDLIAAVENVQEEVLFAFKNHPLNQARKGN